MMNKVFGAKNITHLLYGIAVLLPMLSVLGRVCYTVVNKNAKDSYSGTSNISYISNDDYDDFVVGDNYRVSFLGNMVVDNDSNKLIYFSNFSLVSAGELVTDAILGDIASSNCFTITYYGNRNYLVFKYNATQIRVLDSGYFMTFDFTLNEYIKPNDVSYVNAWGTFISKISKTSIYVDNAFEYSLQSFLDDNNLGNVNLFSWFADLFLDQSKPKNQLYINFVNWYLNYTLLVSSGYLLFMVMIWFTQYVRKIMDKSMYQDFGGF